jgi:ABC-type bacteriocin/lantibiotic exporter with double-glycine peptidase domain
MRAEQNWLQRLAPHVRPYRRSLTWSIALSILGQVLMGMLPLLQKIIVDDAVIAHRRPLLPWLGLLLGATSAHARVSTYNTICGWRFTVTFTRSTLRATINSPQATSCRARRAT